MTVTAERSTEQIQCPVFAAFDLWQYTNNSLLVTRNRDSQFCFKNACAIFGGLSALETTVIGRHFADDNIGLYLP